MQCSECGHHNRSGATDEVIRIQQEMGARPELARSYVLCADLLKDKGDAERARALLTQAVDLFREMGMPRELERAEEMLRQT